jgi:deoxyribose-phosphate aldolase
LAQSIDATLLAPDTLPIAITGLGAAAVSYGVRAICVPPQLLSWLDAADLTKHDVALATVVNFPLGYSCTETILKEVNIALGLGATEIDFVQPIWAVKSGNWSFVESLSKDIIKQAPGAVTKVILETALLTPQEITDSVKCHAGLGINIIKTSTGFGPGGATVADVTLIRASLAKMGLEQTVGIKASGKVASRIAALDLIKAGATRIGTSKTEIILHEG